jgi:predicted RNA-binding Zn ribbon-like protein
MTLGTVTRQLLRDDDSYRIWLKPDHGGWTQVIAEIAADFTQTLLESNGSRFRICDNLDCKWVFYDDTRNRVKRFCEDKTCGNLMKVQRFRARKKEEAKDQLSSIAGE